MNRKYNTFARNQILSACICACILAFAHTALAQYGGDDPPPPTIIKKKDSPSNTDRIDRQPKVVPKDEDKSGENLPPFAPDGENKKSENLARPNFQDMDESFAEENSLLIQAEDAAFDGDYQGAERLYRQAGLADPSSVEPVLGLAGLYEIQGKIPEAEKILQQAKDRKLDNSKIQLALAGVYITKGDFPAAGGILKQELGNNTRSAQANALYGIYYLARKDQKMATQHFRKAGKLDPEIAFVHYDRGIVFLDNDKAKRALWEFQAAANISTTAPEAWLEVGNCYAELGMIKEAEQAFATYGKLVPEEDGMDFAEMFGNTKMGVQVITETKFINGKAFTVTSEIRTTTVSNDGGPPVTTTTTNITKTAAGARAGRIEIHVPKSDSFQIPKEFENIEGMDATMKELQKKMKDMEK